MEKIILNETNKEKVKNIVMNKMGGLEKGKITILCVGSDRSTGDCLGPLVGTFLTDKVDSKQYSNIDIKGTLANPVHAENLEEIISNIPKNNYIIAIDASLGKPDCIDNIIIKTTALKAGIGVGKELGEVGDITITGVVGGYRGHTDEEEQAWINMQVLQSIRLYLVYSLANRIVNLLEELIKRGD